MPTHSSRWTRIRSWFRVSASGVAHGPIVMLSFAICARASMVVYKSPRMRLRPIIRPSGRLLAGEWTTAHQTKVFASELNTGRGRYSPPNLIESETEVLIGNPDEANISKSFVERQNLSVRMECRRFTRLTNAFSKKLANLKASVALHYAHYNFVRLHRTLRMTPAMAAGVADHIWSVQELNDCTQTGRDVGA